MPCKDDAYRLLSEPQGVKGRSVLHALPPCKLRVSAAQDVDNTAAEPASGSAEPEGQGLAAGPSTTDVPDLRETLPRRRSDRGPSGLFSAARAGLVPAFLVPDEERDGAEDLSEEAAMDANGHAAD